MTRGVSFVVPVHNGSACMAEALHSIFAQADGGPLEVIVVDDASRDGSSELLARLAERWPLRIVQGEGRGAAAAINAGIRAARFPVICQVDQDVVLERGWMERLVAALDDPSVGAAQGYYVTDRGATLCARAMGLDLEQRYAAIDGTTTTHVCTGNTAYRAEALERVGLLDESFGYGYDNDLSYRLRDAGYRLVLCRDARSLHRWREGLRGYLAQQYGFGYGRIDLVAKHPRRIGGDAVSPAGMMLHPLMMGLALLCGVGAAVLEWTGGASGPPAFVGLAVVTALILERLAAAVAAARRFRTLTPLVFPVLHLLRDAAWVAAMAVWIARRLAGRRPEPGHSMWPRSAAAPASRGYHSEPGRVSSDSALP